MDLEPYKSFAREKLGFEFRDINLLVAALTHRSFVNESHNPDAVHNERLEFLGDAVLELVSSDFLYRNYNEPEGIMTSWRAALVRTEANCAAGKELGYDHLIRLSKGEKRGTERAHDVIIADCYEAIIGAVYLDQGYPTAKKLIEKHNLSKIDSILAEGSWRDAKSRFQELAQHFDGATPTYRTIREDGPDHDKVFTIGVYVGEISRGIGTGHSKQEAEQNAARQGIAYYKNLEKLETPTENA